MGRNRPTGPGTEVPVCELQIHTRRRTRLSSLGGEQRVLRGANSETGFVTIGKSKGLFSWKKDSRLSRQCLLIR